MENYKAYFILKKKKSENFPLSSMVFEISVITIASFLF